MEHFDYLYEVRRKKGRLIDQLPIRDALIRAIPDGLDVVDATGTILYANDVMKNLFGADLEGKKCYETYRNTEGRCRNCPLGRPIQEGEVCMSIGDDIKGGRIMEIRHVGMQLNDEMVFLEIFRDITEAEKSRHRMTLHHNILRHVDTLVAVMDHSSNITYIAPSVENILGFCPEELMGRKWWDKTYIDNKDAGEKRAELLNILAVDQGTLGPYVRKVRKKDGGFIWVFWKDVKGEENNIISVGQDVTELVETEEQLRRVNKDLETFIYRASHDIRGPLASAIGVARMINSPLGTDDHEKLTQMLMTSLKRMDDVITNLTELGVVQRGKFVLGAINLRDAVEQIISAMDVVIEEAGVSIQLAFDHDVEVIADDDLLKCVLQNLIQNAVKYRSRKEPRLEISVRRRGRKVFVRFADNGRGIAKKYQDKIFDMFYRADNSEQGTGLGLYIVKTSLEKLNGAITLKSELRRGSTFTVVLPRPV